MQITAISLYFMSVFVYIKVYVQKAMTKKDGKKYNLLALLPMRA